VVSWGFDTERDIVDLELARRGATLIIGDGPPAGKASGHGGVRAHHDARIRVRKAFNGERRLFRAPREATVVVITAGFRASREEPL